MKGDLRFRAVDKLLVVGDKLLLAGHAGGGSVLAELAAAERVV